MKTHAIPVAVAMSTLFSMVASHGAMITPAPRSSHRQTWDARNQCGCRKRPEGCYSNATYAGVYCGVGCLGEACLYYQVGCFQQTPVCSLKGKTLYPVLADLGGQPVPPEPTLGGGDPALERKLRTYNIDNSSQLGDWTRWMPWRAPGSTGSGNPKFQPCGINSGASAEFHFPPAHGQAPAGNGSDLPPLPKSDWATWQAGSIQMVEFSLYANHGGGYSYRLCKNEGNPMTEECYQQTPLDFATDMSTAHYWDNSHPDVQFEAVTTKVGTYPAGSMWRKNPVPMCNCDIGIGCRSITPKEAGCDPSDPSTYRQCRSVAYPKSYLAPGQTLAECNDGVQYPTSWLGPNAGGGAGGGQFNWSVQDKIKIPAGLAPGTYSISWRWDCEETPQVWNSCADIMITA